MNLKLKEIRLIRRHGTADRSRLLHCSAVCYSRYETETGVPLWTC